MKNKRKETNWNMPNTITGWVLFVFGILALAGGLMGVVGVDVFTLTSVSAINNGILHFIGVFRRWSIFPYYAILSRMLMGSGLLWLASSEIEPEKLIAGAIFEFVGVLILILALLLDGKRAKIRNCIKHDRYWET